MANCDADCRSAILSKAARLGNEEPRAGTSEDAAVGEADALNGQAAHDLSAPWAMPDDLLEQAHAGASLVTLAHILSERLGRRIYPIGVFGKLVTHGICSRRTPPPGDQLTPEETTRLDQYFQKRKDGLRRLVARAQQRDRIALLELYFRYQIRLPLVESQLDPPLPWMRGDQN